MYNVNNRINSFDLGSDKKNRHTVVNLVYYLKFLGIGKVFTLKVVGKVPRRYSFSIVRKRVFLAPYVLFDIDFFDVSVPFWFEIVSSLVNSTLTVFFCGFSC